jgi:DNA-binding LacI/PurR family transcriptional regulator
VLEHLFSLGHTCIGVPVPDFATLAEFEISWVQERLQNLRRTARSIGSGLTLTCATTTEPLFANPPASSEIALRSQSTENVSRIKKQIPTLLHLLRKKEVTALVALNDRYAWAYYVWLCRAGIRIPEEVSLISFDNSRIAEALGLTSLDFGLDFAGHEAAYLFMDEKKRFQPPKNELVSRPWLAVRKSTASR